MKQSNTSLLILFATLLLAAATLACAQDQAAETAEIQTDAELNAEPDVAAEDTAAEIAPHHAAPNAADWKTKLQVKMALLEGLGTDSLHVDVTSHEGAVQLSGTVEKRETKELAETMAKSVSAVTTVRNDILLQSSLDNPSQAAVAAGEAEAELKDAMLSTKVRLILVDSMGSDGFRIGTEVANGVVTLEFGPELTAARRAEAVQATQGVEGVAEVVSIDKV